MAVMQQTLKPGNIFKIGEILDIANKYLETNIDFSYIKDYIPYLKAFAKEKATYEYNKKNTQIYNKYHKLENDL